MKKHIRGYFKMDEYYFPEIGRLVSIFDRLMKMYYDRGLSGYDIGWGQQFYVEYLYRYPGASPQEMAERIRVDKGTLTKTIKKLSEVGYIRVESDRKDRRVKHLYLTEKAVPAAEQIRKIHADFYHTLSKDISPSEIKAAEQTLQRMTDNINQKVWHRMEAHHGE